MASKPISMRRILAIATTAGVITTTAVLSARNLARMVASWTHKPSSPTPIATSHWELRKEIIATAIAMNTIGINKGTSGNVSVRVPGGFLITPSGMAYEQLSPDQIVFIDATGGYYGDYLPSSEWRMHHDIYITNADAKAIIHAHPTYSTALSAQRMPIPAFHYMVCVVQQRSNVPIMPRSAHKSYQTTFSLLSLAEHARACCLTMA
eukprot:m.77541 g.77541  ORF g.77541 m.77541 type:complete len:207 (-) comp25024_c0_seq3:256-876(-)